MTAFTTDDLQYAKTMLARARLGNYSISNWGDLALASERQYRLCAKEISERLTRRPGQADMAPEQALQELRTANHMLGRLESIMYGSRFYNHAYPVGSIPKMMEFPGTLDAGQSGAEMALAARMREASPIGMHMASIILGIDKVPLKEGSPQQKTVQQAAKRIGEILEDQKQEITGGRLVNLIGDTVASVIGRPVAGLTHDTISAAIKNGHTP